MGYDHLRADGVRRENYGLDANMRGFRTGHHASAAQQLGRIPSAPAFV